MRYAGETYHLHVAAQVNANAANSSKFVNQGYTIINNTMSSFKKVEIEPRHSEPALSIEKTVPKYEYQVGDTIDKQVPKYEWQVGDTIEYTIQVSQTAQNCVARNVKIQDTSLPEGFAW